MTRAARNLLDFLSRNRSLAAVVTNIGIIAVSYVAAFLLRFDFSLPEEQRRTVAFTLPAAIAIQYAAFYAFNLTRGWWRYVGVTDFVNAVKAAFVGGMGLGTYVILLHRESYPRSIFFIHAVLVVGLSIGLRLAVRLLRQLPADEDGGARKRLLIIGAGDTGEALLREIRHSARLPYNVVAFMDDDPAKRGAFINGVRVLDEIAAAPAAVNRLLIDEIIVATPSASGVDMRRIIDACRSSRVPFKVMPATWEVLRGRAGLGAAREVDINDLLRRPPVDLDMLSIGRFLTRKRVLVTGAAGSIGSEICRQLLRFQPATVACVDHDENALFYLQRSLSTAEGDFDIRYRLLDVTDAGRIEALFAEIRPQVVFHAAAHKHVPMLEDNPVEGLRNNVLGTEVVATTAGRHGAEAFVLISTDKAVRPSSVMGASKRIAELLIQTLPYPTRYAAVRFGNVLGSQGSVVPLFKEQIAAGGPVTVTHPEMRRYFMTIPEAVELVIQASAMGKGNEVFVLDMGEPVKIADLAADLIRLSGLRPGEDIEIAFTGVRPGEKLYEELHLDAEDADRTQHPKILVAKHAEFGQERFLALLGELKGAIARSDLAAARRLLPALVPEYLSRPVSSASGAVVPLAGARG